MDNENMANDAASTTRSFTLLFILGWGLVLLAAFARSVYLCIRKLLRGNETQRVSNDGTLRRGSRILLETYRNMSSARRHEIDNLRKNAILRYLKGFTLEVGDEHLLRRSGPQTLALSASKKEEVTDAALSASTKEEVTEATLSASTKEEVVVDEETLTLDETGEDLEDIDIEEGNNVDEKRDDLAQSQDNDLTAAADSAEELTHISIPLPGFDITGRNIYSIAETEKQDKLPEDDIEAMESQPEKPESVTVNNNPKQLHLTEKRSVPKFCAICLSEYEKCDRVCWSSNKECTHVFHEDCIQQWLITSGKKRSTNKYFSKHPTDKELLQNADCPCCRQDFTCVNANSAMHGSEENV